MKQRIESLIKFLKLVEEKYFWQALVCLQILLIAVFGLTSNETVLDEDVAKLFYHTMKFAEEGFLFGDWTYVTTFEMDTSALFAIPFYLITRNIYLSFDLANVVWACLYVAIVYDVTRRLNLPEKYRWMTALLFLIPYGVGMLDYFNMLLYNGGQYVVKAILPVMLIDLLLMKEQKPLEWVIYGGYIFLLFLTSACSSIYVFICGIFPVLLVEFFRLYILRKGKFDVWKLSLLLGSLVAVGLGLLINVILPAGAKGNDMKLVWGSAFFEYAGECIVGMFTLFSATVEDYVAIISVKGICTLIMFGFVMTMLVLLMREVKNLKDSKVPYTVFAIFGWNLFILLASYTKYGGAFAHRYHIIGFFALFVLVGFVASTMENISHERLRRFFKVSVVGYMILVFAVSNVSSFLKIREDRTASERAFAEKIVELNADRIFIADNTALSEITRLLNYKEKTEILDCTVDGRVFGNFDYYKSVNDAVYFADKQEHYVLFTNKDDIEEFPEYLQELYTYYGNVGGLHAYHADKFLMDGRSCQPFLDKEIDYADSYNYSYYGTMLSGRVLKTHGYISDETNEEAFVLMTPNFERSFNALKVTLHYETDEVGEIGELCMTESGVVKKTEKIVGGKTAVTLELTPSKGDLQVMIRLKDGKELKVLNLVYEK